LRERIIVDDDAAGRRRAGCCRQFARIERIGFADVVRDLQIDRLARRVVAVTQARNRVQLHVGSIRNAQPVDRNPDVAQILTGRGKMPVQLAKLNDQRSALAVEIHLQVHVTWQVRAGVRQQQGRLCVDACASQGDQPHRDKRCAQTANMTS
jgi:hypothetical protein